MSALDNALNDGASAGTFVGGAEKQQLAEQQTPLGIVGTDPRTETQYGDQTHFYVRSKIWGDEQRILAFSHNAFRERQARNVQKLIDETSKPQGPVYLGRFRTQSGKDAWQLGTAPFSGEHAQPVATPITETPAAAPVAQDFDADLPF
jgi:hypothetical protein